jgi:hypothetical protein
MLTTCPHCEADCSVAREEAGLRLRCPACGGRFYARTEESRAERRRKAANYGIPPLAWRILWVFIAIFGAMIFFANLHLR